MHPHNVILLFTTGLLFLSLPSFHSDLGNVNPAAIHNLFNNILRWSESRANVITAI